MTSRLSHDFEPCLRSRPLGLLNILPTMAMGDFGGGSGGLVNACLLPRKLCRRIWLSNPAKSLSTSKFISDETSKYLQLYVTATDLPSVKYTERIMKQHKSIQLGCQSESRYAGIGGVTINQISVTS